MRCILSALQFLCEVGYKSILKSTLVHSYLRANWKLAEVLAETFLGLSEGLLPAEETNQNQVLTLIS